MNSCRSAIQFSVSWSMLWATLSVARSGQQGRFDCACSISSLVHGERWATAGASGRFSAGEAGRRLEPAASGVDGVTDTGSLKVNTHGFRVRLISNFTSAHAVPVAIGRFWKATSNMPGATPAAAQQPLSTTALTQRSLANVNPAVQPSGTVTSGMQITVTDDVTGDGT